MLRDRSYVSEEDLFLKKFDRVHTELTSSQRKEIEKHAKIAKKRDKKEVSDKQDKIWSEF